MPKHAVKIPARRAGKRVRWMLEVSADVGKRTAHARTPRKHARPKRKKSPVVAPAAPITLPHVGDESARQSPFTQMPPRASDTTAAGMAVVVVVGAIVIGALALTAYPSRPVTAVAKTVQPEAVAPVHRAAPVVKETRQVSLASPVAAEPSPAARAIVEKPRPTPVSSKIVWPPASLRSSPPAVAATATGAGSPETAAAERVADASTVAAQPDAVSQAVTTMTGCLEATVDGDEFRLTDTEGADAPKARSWRSGFLKKRAAPIELAEVSDRAGLRKYVGHRVVATGFLAGRELRVRSFQSAGTSCE